MDIQDWIDLSSDFEQLITRVRAIVGPNDIPIDEPAARRAFLALKDGNTTPDPRDLRALGRLLRRLRPAPLSVKGLLGELPVTGGTSPYSGALRHQWETFRQRARAWLPSIGLILRGSAAVGTGFVVQEGVLATNRHVVDDVTSGTGEIPKERVRVVFNREHGSVDHSSSIAEITAVLKEHPEQDLALLSMSPVSAVPLALSSAPVRVAESVVVVGHPLYDPRRNPHFLTPIFNGTFGVKRGALGQVVGVTADGRFHHDCSTTGGNSGSPIFSLETGELVGMHAAGMFMYRNEAIGAHVLKAWI